LYEVECDFNKPKIYDKCINIAYPFKHSKKPYKEFPKKIRKEVEYILEHIVKKVWANANDEQYDYLLKCIASICQGRKLDVYIYNRSIVQGIGKKKAPGWWVVIE